jgi:hypothetical protein
MKNLIISTGDISDIDGFFALNEYVKTDNTVLFIINYPAYINNIEITESTTNDNGLGYIYDSKPLFEEVRELEIMKINEHLTINEQIKKALTNIAFEICKKVIENKYLNNLYFCIGGINSINPFSSKSIKNEVSLYREFINIDNDLPITEGIFFNSNNEIIDFNLNEFQNIIIDFNGSMSFLNDIWISKLNNIIPKIKGVFIMGGVEDNKPVMTIPSIPNVLNRFSCATMNQLYHPKYTSNFFDFLNINKITNVYTISNNSVKDLKTFENIEKFMIEHNLMTEFNHKLANIYYNSKYNPPKKIFDYYTAIAIAKFINEESINYIEQNLHYNDVYGITIISNETVWKNTLDNYISNINIVIDDSDSDFIKMKKTNFIKEFEILTKLSDIKSLKIKNLIFE